jgi:transcriptional regulator with XRE-family HTH domain
MNTNDMNEIEILQKIGARMREIRLEQNMKQKELAEKLGVTDKAVSKWERDLSYPDITLFPRLADLLGVTVDDLLRESKNGGQPSRLLQIFEMSHDIRTPLHIILGCANMASLHHEDTALLLRYLESIRISGEYLLQVIDRVMEVTHQEQKDPAEKASGFTRDSSPGQQRPDGSGGAYRSCRKRSSGSPRLSLL